MSGTEAALVFGAISSIISIVNGAKQVYDAAKNVLGLPAAFREVAARLPIVENILSSAKEHISAGQVDEVSCRGVKSVLETCWEKAQTLHELFRKAIPAEGASDFKRYYKAVKAYGKGNEVENLMKGILEDVQLLAFEHGMKLGTDAQKQEISHAVNDLSRVAPSVPDSEFQDSGLTAINSGPGTQYNAQGDYIAQGSAQIYHSGGGPMHFGTKVDEAKACLQALFLTDPRDDRARLEHIKGSRVDGTCKWIKNNALYNKWLNSKSQLLWLSGGPGKGKTMLSIFIAEELEQMTRLSQTRIFLQYFCDNKDEKRNSAVTVIRGLVFQLLQCRRQLFNHILPYFEVQNNNLFTNSSFESLWRIFENMIRDSVLGDIYCILDGLDECDEASLRVLLERLKALCRTEPGNFKLIVVSRDLPRFITNILAGFPRIKLDPDAGAEVSCDIRQFIDVKVDELSTCSSTPYPKALRELVRNAFQTRAEGTFLWVGLAARALEECEVTEVESALERLPRGLSELYARLLLQIPKERREIAARILRWVVITLRPLRLSELSTAVEVAVRPSVCLTPTDVMRDYVLRCGYFLTIKTSKDSTRDEDAEVGLIHQSAKDYLVREDPNPNPELEVFRVKGKAANLEVARKCLDYLQSGVLPLSQPDINLRGFPREENQFSRAYPLLSYATLHWPDHAKPLAHSEDIFDLSHSFYAKPREIWRYWLEMYWYSEGYSCMPESFTLLHLASYAGILPLAQRLLHEYVYMRRDQRVHYLDERDSRGSTALRWAVIQGHQAVVRLLLDNGADVEAESKVAGSALWWAAHEGHEVIVRQLLDKGADTASKHRSVDQSTALITAATHGHQAVVQALLEDRADIEARNANGSTALIKAAQEGHKAVVKLLVEHGADVEAKDTFGETALDKATRMRKWGHTEHEYKAVVQLLQQRLATT